MQERLTVLVLFILAAYAAFTEYRWQHYDVPHIQWDAERAVCQLIPEHCGKK